MGQSGSLVWLTSYDFPFFLNFLYQFYAGISLRIRDSLTKPPSFLFPHAIANRVLWEVILVFFPLYDIFLSANCWKC